MSSTGLPNLVTIGGLPEEEARRRLKQEGPNELPTSRRRSLLGIALSVVHEPMFLLLLAGGGIYLALGDVREALVLAVFLSAQYWHLGELTTRAMAFTTLVLANLGLVLANRSRSRLVLATLRTRNAALWWVVGGTILLLILVLSVPALRDLFAFSLLSPLELLWCLGAGIASLLWFEIVKIATRRYVKHG